MLGQRILARLVCTHQVHWPCIHTLTLNSRSALQGTPAVYISKSPYGYWAKLPHVQHHPGASNHFCCSETQAQAPNNRSCPLYEKNSSVLFTAVGLQSISYPKEHILSFSSSGSCIFHPHSFPIDAHRLLLLSLTLKCYWAFFPLTLFMGSWKGTLGFLCAYHCWLQWDCGELDSDSFTMSWLPQLFTSVSKMNPSHSKMQGRTSQFWNWTWKKE